MKRTRLLHSDISFIIASMGHTDALIIADAGFPVPQEVNKVDLAISAGHPPFTEVLETVLSELCVEKVVLAKEIQSKNEHMERNVRGILSVYERTHRLKLPIDFISHESFKKTSRDACVIIRTGECSPFSNIILYAGVTF